MDDKVDIPADCHVMGRGQIIGLTASLATAALNDAAVKICASETFGKPNLNLKTVFKMGEEVVFKALRESSKVFRANYVRRVKDCLSGKAKVVKLMESYGFLEAVTPAAYRGGQIFFVAIAYGNYEARNFYSLHRDCRLFFRVGDIVEYVATPDTHKRDSLYCFYCDLTLNDDCVIPPQQPQFSISSKKNCADSKNKFVGIVVSFLEQSDQGSCQIYVRTLGVLVLKASDLHPKLSDLGDVMQTGERVGLSLVYEDDERLEPWKIVSVELLDCKTKIRFKKWKDTARITDDDVSKSSIPFDRASSKPSSITSSFDDFLDDTLDAELEALNFGSDETNGDYADPIGQSTLHSDVSFSKNAVSAKCKTIDERHKFLIAPDVKNTENFRHLSPTRREADYQSWRLPNRSELSNEQINDNAPRRPIGSAFSSLRSDGQPIAAALASPTQQNLSRYERRSHKTLLAAPIAVLDESVDAVCQTRNVETQTETSFERQFFEKLIDDRDIFEFLASNKPTFIRDWYKFSRKINILKEY
uniref:Uncharacterized protein n=1 Tax=Romanomermis culicivorax TaxID=13658 RepID=A0A915IIC7_ROMCU